jgi:hypothetical protein
VVAGACGPGGPHRRHEHRVDHLPARLQRALPDYTGTLQQQVDQNASVRGVLDLADLRGKGP